jgi:hypothetical protein
MDIEFMDCAMFFLLSRVFCKDDVEVQIFVEISISVFISKERTDIPSVIWV